MPRSTGIDSGRSAASAPGVGRRGHHGGRAAIVAFAYALVSLYWAVGGRGLVGTVGGFLEQIVLGERPSSSFASQSSAAWRSV
jgi:hypothetical protein